LDASTALVPVVAELRPAGGAPADQPADPRAPSTILVEAEAGQSGLGVFLLENTTAQHLSIPVTVSAFIDQDGREAHPTVEFRPDVIALDPGDQFVVQVAAA